MYRLPTFSKSGENVSVNFTSTYKNAAKQTIKLDPSALKQENNSDKFLALADTESGNIIINDDGTFTVKTKIAKTGNFKVKATYNYRNSNGETIDGSFTKAVTVKLKKK